MYKATQSGNFDYYYDENWQLLETRQGGDPDPLEQNVWHSYYIDALALRHYDANRSGTQVTHYFAHDANFNHTAVFDANKAVIERYWYLTPYGDVGVLDANYTFDGDGLSDISNTTLFTGRSLDVETGLYYYRNRYCHAQLGRFVGRDPIGYEGSQWNLYEYVSGNPISRRDPFGEAWSWNPFDWFKSPAKPPCKIPAHVGLPKETKNWTTNQWQTWFKRRMKEKGLNKAARQLFLDEQMAIARRTGNKKAAEAIALLMTAP